MTACLYQTVERKCDKQCIFQLPPIAALKCAILKIGTLDFFEKLKEPSPHMPEGLHPGAMQKFPWIFEHDLLTHL